MLSLVEVKDPDQVEWLRVQRSKPELYKYFRQDKPITPVEQSTWWKRRDRSRLKLFLVQNVNTRIGYVGFNPLNRYARSAEFGIFILPEYHKEGNGTEALSLLLDYGFGHLYLSVIYSDVLDYPGENTFAFYEKMGFVRRENALPKSYPKQGVKINSIPFYMGKETWLSRGERDKNGEGQLASVGAAATSQEPVKRKRGRPRLHPSKVKL